MRSTLEPVARIWHVVPKFAQHISSRPVVAGDVDSAGLLGLRRGAADVRALPPDHLREMAGGRAERWALVRVE